MRWYQTLSFVVLFGLSFIGAMVSSILVHELTHKEDMQPYIAGEDRVCYLTWPTNVSEPWYVGYYEYLVPTELGDSEEFLAVEENTEKHAYKLTTAMLVPYMACLLIGAAYLIEKYYCDKWEREDGA